MHNTSRKGPGQCRQKAGAYSSKALRRSHSLLTHPLGSRVFCPLLDRYTLRKKTGVCHFDLNIPESGVPPSLATLRQSDTRKIFYVFVATFSFVKNRLPIFLGSRRSRIHTVRFLEF